MIVILKPPIPKSVVFSLQGEADISSDSPVLFIIDGHQPYIWIGNDGANNKGCYATITGRDRMRRIAQAILKATK